MRRYLSSILSSALGNILEWYDFGLFTIFSSLFSKLFFPTSNPHVALITTFSIFAIGFLCRPIGALIFGYLGDKQGRARTLRLSILMITLPTLFIGVLPTYQHIGIFAPILLTLTRMWQGISIGGEYSGNIIYLAETAPKKHRAFFTSLASTGANLGILLAGLVGLITTNLISTDTLESFGWRLPYLISGVLCLFIYYFRLQIRETDVFQHLKKQNLLVKNPIKTAFTTDFPQLLRTVGLVCMGSTFYYFCFIYIPLFLADQEIISVKTISFTMTIFILLMIILVPLAGLLCDKMGRRKMFLMNATLITLCVIPGFYFLQTNTLFAALSVLFLFTIASSLEQGATSITVVENFPCAARYTGLSLGYNIGNGFLGGTVPIVCAWLLSITQISLMPAIYIAICAAITWCVVYFFIPETKNISLENRNAKLSSH